MKADCSSRRETHRQHSKMSSCTELLAAVFFLARLISVIKAGPKEEPAATRYGEMSGRMGGIQFPSLTCTFCSEEQTSPFPPDTLMK